MFSKLQRLIGVTTQMFNNFQGKFKQSKLMISETIDNDKLGIIVKTNP